MPGVSAEGEVEQGVDHSGGVDGPLHDGDVGLTQGQELGQGEQGAGIPVGQNILHVEQLEGSAGGFEDEDDEEADEREPEVGGSESASATSGALNKESKPGDDQEDDREHEGQEEGGEVEVEAGGGAPVDASVHADGGVVGSAGDDVLVGVLGPGPDLGEERAGDSEQSGEEPDHGDVDGVGPGSGHVLALGPLGVLHEQVVGQEQDGQRQEEQEAVVEVSKTDAIFQSKVPGQMNYLRVQSERNTQSSQQDISY